jgi:predicted permease
MNVKLIVRSLLKDWRFSLFIIGIVGAGIALTTATFTIAAGVLFQPLAVQAPERLVRVFVKAPWGEHFWPQISFPEYLDLRDEARSFEAIAAFANDMDVDVGLRGREPLRAHGAVATGNLFSTLGVTAQRGRLFGPEDDRPGNAVAVLSDDFWRTHFDGRADALGAAVRVNDTLFTVVGIAPPRFHGVAIDVPTDVWIPASMSETVMRSFPGVLADRKLGWISTVGRLRSGVTLAQSQAEVRAITVRHAVAAKRKDPKAVLYSAAARAIDPEARPQLSRLVMLFGIFVGIVLVIACLNAGSLQLVRGERRQRELAIRAALGASRTRLLRELTIEGAVLALAAGVLGIVLARTLITLLFTLTSGSFPLMLHASLPVIDWRVALVVFGLTALASLACGFIPALRVTRLDLQRSIRGDQAVGRSATLRGALVIAQIALSVVVLIAAGLMIRTLRNVRRVDPGFGVQHTATAKLDLSRQGYDRPRALAFFDTLRARLGAAPGVTGVAIGQALPMSEGGMMTSVTIPGHAAPPGEDEHSPMNLVAPGYFHALGVPLLRGREFTDHDRKGGEQVVIINDTFARRFWGTDDVVDRHFSIGDTDVRIVGVVRTVKIGSVREEPVSMLYQPRAQSPTRAAEIAVRVRGDEAAAVALLRRTIRSLDGDVPIHDLQTFRQRLGRSWAREEALASLLTIFGALALLLASVGLFSVVSYRTEMRHKELGIRIAVGARAADIIALVVRHTTALLTAGVLLGLGASAMIGRLAQTFLYAVTPFDALTFSTVAAVFFAAGLLAAWLPARRATAIDPMLMLRAE